jgi:hypothetical protein
MVSPKPGIQLFNTIWLAQFPGHVRDEIKSHLLRGRFSFISKPYGKAALAAKLEEVLAEV